MPLESLAGRHFLILGGSDGMGYAVAEYLLRSDSVVTICARNAEKLEAARKAMLAETGADSARLRAKAADACDAASVDEAFGLAANREGEVNGAFIVAGGSIFKPVLENTPAKIAREYALNMFPVVNAINSAVPRMKAGGSIVALSSVAAVQSLQGLSGYNAAKAALEQYVRTAADELGHLKVRINAVRPGLTKNGRNASMLADQAYIERFTAKTPLGPYGFPEDFGPMVALLLSEDTRWITGQIFSIDGGLSIRGYGGKIMPD